MKAGHTLARAFGVPISAIAFTVAFAAAFTACDGSLRGKGDVKVEGVLIAQATGNVEAEEGPTVTLVAGQRPEDVVLPEGPVVRLAMARDVTYRAARQMIALVEKAGKRPIILVGERFRLRALKLNDELTDPKTAIRLVATPDGKACVAPPDNPESRCVKPQYSNHISTAFVREFVRDAVKGYGLREVRVFVRPSLDWADAVRAVDGARTCCDGKIIPRVRLADADVDPLAPPKPDDETAPAAPRKGLGPMGVPPTASGSGAGAGAGDGDGAAPGAAPIGGAGAKSGGAADTSAADDDGEEEDIPAANGEP